MRRLMLESNIQQLRGMFSASDLSMSEEELLLYYTLIRVSGANHVIEYGTAFGVSASWAAMALMDNEATGKVWTVDIKDRRGELVYENTPVEHMIETIVSGFNAKLFRKIHRPIKNDGPILVLLDGPNGYEYYKKGWDAVFPRLAPEDWVVLHDTMSMKGANQVVFEEGSRFFTFPTKFGLSVCKCIL
jgi:predicted O-methyltransferase YrrM